MAGKAKPKTIKPHKAVKPKMTPEQLQGHALEIIKRLKKLYPDARTALNFSSPLEMLMATVLSAQTTDAGVNTVTPELFARFKTAADYAKADPAEMEKLIHRTGFFRQKTKALIAIGKTLSDKFGGQVPDTMEQLLELPSVARKTANVVLGSALGKAQGIAVDRHVARVAGRLGLTAQEDPVKIEQDLMAVVPRKQWIFLPLAIINHGRAICTARTPLCDKCALNDICPSAFTFGNRP